MVAGIPSGKRIEEALAGKIVCEQGIRLQNHPHLLEHRTERRSAKGLLLKAHLLVYQLAHAATVNAQLVTAGLAAANLTVVASSLTADGLGHLTTQAQNGSVFFVHPTDIATVGDRTCATMLVTAGPVLEVLAGEAASVVDTIIWPLTTAYLVSTRAAGDVPAFQDAIPTADALMAFVRKYVANHSLEAEFHAAASGAAVGREPREQQVLPLQPVSWCRGGLGNSSPGR